VPILAAFDVPEHECRAYFDCARRLRRAIRCSGVSRRMLYVFLGRGLRMEVVWAIHWALIVCPSSMPADRAA